MREHWGSLHSLRMINQKVPDPEAAGVRSFNTNLMGVVLNAELTWGSVSTSPVASCGSEQCGGL